MWQELPVKSTLINRRKIYMNAKLRKILAVLVCLAMLAGFATVHTASGAVLEEGKTYTAQLLGQLEADFSADVGEWGLGEVEGNEAKFKIGEEATISLEFEEAVKFTGNWTGISTNIAVFDDEDAVSANAKILAFIVDGEDLGAKAVPVIDRDGGGNLCIDIARQWGGDYDDYDLAGMDPFTTIEIKFIVEKLPAKGTNFAWIGGTFYLEDEDKVDWKEFDDQRVKFFVGEKFTAGFNLKEDKIEHDEADWPGWVLCVQTDIPESFAADYDVILHSITLDGEDLPFDKDLVKLGTDPKGLRLGLTNYWDSDAMFSTVGAFGEFSKLEVEMEIIAAEPTEGTDGNEGTDAATGDGEDGDEDEDDDGIPVWVWIAIIGGVVALIAIIAVVAKKKR